MRKIHLSLLLASAAIVLSAAPAHAIRTSGGTFGSTLNGVPAAIIAGNQHSTVYTEHTATKEAVDAQLGSLFARPKAGSMGLKDERRVGTWASANWTKARDEQKGGEWDAHLGTAMLGADFRFNDMFVAGLALSYSHHHGDTAFNKGRIRDNSYGVVPYIDVRATDWLSFCLAGGYNRVLKKRERVDMTVAALGRQVQGNVSSDRWFVAPAANFTHKMDKWDLLGRLGYSYARDSQDGFVESDGSTYSSQKFNLSRLHLKAQLGYQWKENVKPYLFGLYSHDFSESKQGLLLESAAPAGTNYINPEQHRNKNTWGAGAGLDFLVVDRWTGAVEYTFKKNADVQTNAATFKVRYSF